MPLTGHAKTAYQRRYMRERNARHRRQAALFAEQQPKEEPPEFPDDPAGALVDWIPDALKVPTGPLQTCPFILGDWQADWLGEAMAPGITEAGLSVARKNGKSGLIGAALLAYLDGPLCTRNWRAVVCSLTGGLAKELWDAMEATARVSDLNQVEFYKTPPPGRIMGRFGTRVDFLAADKATGHAIGADLAIIDEAGLLPEGKRDLWNAILSAVSGRNGRLWAISIRGDGPMFGELEERQGEPGVFWREWAADPKAAYDDEAQWHAANPGLADGIKSIDYMRYQSLRAMTTPANGPTFAAYDLNLPQEPSREMILTLAQWEECNVDKLPPRDGPCFLGIDLGGSASMTAADAYWPETGRMEAFGAFPATPDLKKRGEGDGVGGLYVRMRERGELQLYPGRVTDPVPFFDFLASRLAGSDLKRVALDRFRKEEARNAFEAAGWRVPVDWRGQGHSHTADGSADVRAFQTAALSGRIKTKRSLLLEHAIAMSSIARDASGNPKLDKAKSSGRIDALQAAVLAVGLGERWRSKPRKSRYHGKV